MPTLRETVDPARDRREFSAAGAPWSGIEDPGDGPSVGRAGKTIRPPENAGERVDSADPDGARLGFVVALARWRARMDFERWLKSADHERRGTAMKLPEVRIVDLPTNDYSEL